MELIIKFGSFHNLNILIVLLISLVSVLSQSTSSLQQQQQSSRGRPILVPKLLNKKQEATAISEQQLPKTNQTTTTNRINLNNNNQEKRSTSNNSSNLARLEIIEDELPADFYEMPPEQLDLGMNATGMAPNPILNVAVLKNGQVIDNGISVSPGTQLEMVIYLDDKSAKVYGLLASFLKVKDDTFRQREEVIILNGCSLDTYIFGNFELDPYDQSLRAKFKAFKFPDSNFIRFVGTVNVCIKQCSKVNCSGVNNNNNEAGNRRKRSPSSSSSSSGNNKQNVLLTVSTVLRISNPTTTTITNNNIL